MTFRLRIGINPLAWVFILLFFMGVAGCAPRPGMRELSTVPQGEAALRQVTIKVASTRARDAATGAYSDDRAPALSYESFTISIPPTHKPTQIEWPKVTPDPQTSFAVTDRRVLPGIAMTADPARSGSARGGSGKHDVLIFVHGYNYSFAESLFRLAQIAADGDLTETPILFAWPSSASVTGYVEDKDAVTYSRDDLVELLADVAGDPSVGNITLVGHSMGGWLVAEALRQLRLSGQDKVIARLGNVVLAAPDIDLDVFRRQLQTIGPLNPPMTLLVSPDDRALKLSEWLAGAHRKVGTTDVNDPRVQALAAANGVRVIDISKVDAVSGTNHNRFAALMNALPRRTRSAFTSLVYAGAYILEPISDTLVDPAKQ